MGRFWVVGPIAWDWVLRIEQLPSSGDFIQAQSATGRPGGAGANVALALTSTSAPVRLVGYVGQDRIGTRLLETLQSGAVDIAHVMRFKGRTSQVLIFIEPSGERTMVGFLPDHLADVALPVDEIQAGEIIYFAAWHSEFVPAMAELQRRGALVATVPPQGEWTSLPARLVIGSESQFGNSDEQSALRRCADLVSSGALECVVVTKGARGATAYTRQGRLDEPAMPVKVVDATGAGDAFAAGFLWWLAGGCPIPDALQAGLRWAAAAVNVPQSIPPPWPAAADRPS
ncbi:MAG TPA: PfkB family carbohydrate kinase [Alphaproteobacteria bacterium]|nr:PfkB family carbohydrate kinase [Alphaproteobacteria bacterium]